MNVVVRWFHQLASPPIFDRFTARWAPWCYALAVLLLGVGIWQALFAVPADYQQGDSFRILYIHVPSAWMSLFVFGLMALYAAIALIWRIKICEILAMACAPIGAAFTVITLLTGSIWGKPMWGAWWDWDPRLTTELILLFLYLGVIGLYHAIDDRRQAARAAALLAIVGVALLPVIRYSVVWWNSLHQGQSIRLLGPSTIDASMLLPLWLMVIGTKFWFVGSLLTRARRQPAPRGRQGLDRGRCAGECGMSYLPYVIAAYAVFVLVLLWDLIAGRWQVRRALKTAQARRLRERKRAVPGDAELIR